jgi:hypothetical protein
MLLTASIAGKAIAQQSAHKESVSTKVINPIAFLMKFTVENQYSPSLWNSRGEGNEVQGEIVVPFEAFAKQNLVRMRIFFETSSPDGTRGLAQSQVVDWILFQRGWGTFGVQLSFQVEYNRKNIAGQTMWTLTAGVTLIPKQ